MIIYLYRWKLHPEKVASFIEGWSEVTRFLKKNGGLGSRLHQGNDGIHYGYAQWPSREAREQASFDTPSLAESRQKMSAAVIERLEEIELTPIADLLAHPARQIRIARPIRDPKAALRFYRDALGFALLGKFEDHDGFDGIMLGHPLWPYHLEFTSHREHPIAPTPTSEDLIVLYLPDTKEWNQRIAQMKTHGFNPVKSHNPYWDQRGTTFEDSDGYRVVLQNGSWEPSHSPAHP